MSFHSPYPHLTPAFVGRKEELDEGLRFYEERKDKGGMLLIEGQRGYGKSRYVDELVSKIKDERPEVTIWKTSGKGVGRQPLHPFTALLPWKEMVESVMGHSPASVLPEYDERYLVFNAMARRLREMVEATPAILVLEDLHLCDDMSLYLLHYTLRYGVPVVIVASVSPEEVDPKAATGQTLALMGRERLYKDVPLPSLSKKDVDAMISNMLGHKPQAEVLKRIWDFGEGNPFVIVQLIQSFISEGRLKFKDSKWVFTSPVQETKFPRSVEALMRSKLSALSEDGSRALDVCAVLGPVVSFPVFRNMLSLSEDEAIDLIESLMEKGLLVPVDMDEGVWGDEEYTFPTQLLFRLAYESIPGDQRGALHIKAADALDQYSNSREVSRDEFMPLIARHYFLGGQWGRALPLYLGAGKKAEAVSAYIDARDLYAEATLLMEGETGAPPELYARALLDTVRMSLLTGEAEMVQKKLETALEVSQKNGLRRMEIEGRIYRGEIEMEKEDYPAAEKICLETLQDAVLMGDMEHIGWCFERLGQVYWRLGKLKHARDYLTNGLSYTYATGDRKATAKINTDLGKVWLSSGEPHKALVSLRKAEDVLRDTPNKYEEARIYYNMGLAYYLRGELELSERMYANAERLSESIGALKIYGASNQGLAEVRLEEGDLDGSEVYLKKAMGVVDMMGKRFYTVRSCVTRGKIAAIRKKDDDALSLLEEAVDLAGSKGLTQEKAEALVALGIFFKERGNNSKAWAALDRAERIFHKMGNQLMLERVSDARGLKDI